MSQNRCFVFLMLCGMVAPCACVDTPYDFISHPGHNLLLTIHGQACYLTKMEGAMQQFVVQLSQNQLQERVKTMITEKGGGHSRVTSLEEMRDQYGDVLAQWHCHNRTIFLLQLDYLSCDFEQAPSLCAWADNSNRSLQWRVATGDTPTPVTGPHSDHSLGTDQGHYLYMDAMSAIPGEVAEIHSLEINVEGGLCLRFWYNMYGEDVGTLTVLAHSSSYNTSEELWSLSDNQGHWWRLAEVSIPTSRDSSHAVRVSFQATRGAGVLGDIAIDDVSSNPGSCTASRLTCSFDQRGLCEWSQVGAVDQMDWRVKAGGNASGSGLGFYLQMEGDAGGPGDTADLQSPVLHLTHPLCLLFTYSMPGAGVEELDVVLKNVRSRTETFLWGRSGPQTPGWNQGHVTVLPPADPHTPVQLLFRATRGRSEDSDVAIDGVRGMLGSCDQYENVGGATIIG